MSFDWKSAAASLAKVGLPYLANAVIPGSGLAITMIEQALGMAPGTATPDAVIAATSNPESLIKLQELQNKHEETLVKMAYDAGVSLAKEEKEDLGSARNLAEIDISHGNALTSMLSAMVRPSWGLISLAIFVYSVYTKVPLDPMAHDVMDTILKFYFGGKVVEAITPHLAEMVATFGRK